jgi:hypothetical protein
VAQRFTAAVTGLFSESALAAAVRLRRGKYFFRNLFSRADKSFNAGSGKGTTSVVPMSPLKWFAL